MIVIGSFQEYRGVADSGGRLGLGCREVVSQSLQAFLDWIQRTFKKRLNGRSRSVGCARQTLPLPVVALARRNRSN